MIRGTTPTIPLHVDTDISDHTIYVTLENSGNEITLENDRLTVEYVPAHGNQSERTNISFILTQEETLALGMGMVEIQIRAIKDGVAVATDIVKTNNGRILLEGVIDE